MLQCCSNICLMCFFQGQTWMTRSIAEDVITTVAVLLERTTPTSEICDFFCWVKKCLCLSFCSHWFVLYKMFRSNIMVTNSGVRHQVEQKLKCYMGFQTKWVCENGYNRCPGSIGWQALLMELLMMPRRKKRSKAMVLNDEYLLKANV